jgi:hypothetical protein
VNTCTNEVWYASACGQREQGRLEAGSNTSKCRSTIQNGARPAHALQRVAMAQTALGDAWRRANTPGGNAACQSGSGVCDNVRAVSSTRPVTNTTPMTGTLVGRLVGQAQGASVDGQTRLESLHAPWRANGAVSSSCEEYVFHKYEGYSLFEDAVLAGLGTPRLAMNVAFTEQAGDRHRRALGVRNAILDWNDRPLKAADLFPAFQQPKNDFTAVPFAAQPTVVDRLPVIGPNFQITGYIDTPRLDTVGVQPGLVDDGLRNKLAALVASGDGVHLETFGWHAQRSASAARSRVTDEELERGAALSAELRALVAQRAQTIASRVFCAPALDLVTTSVMPSSLDQLSPIWNPADGLDVATPYFEPVGASFDLAALMPGVSFFGEVTMAANDDGCATLWDDDLRRALYAIDRDIEAVVHRADAYGCLEPGVTRCDWSPGLFASRVRGLFEVERQAHLDRCLAETGGTAQGYATTLVSEPNEFDYRDAANVWRPAVVQGVVCQAGLDYRSTPDQVERYFACRKAKLEGQKAGDEARIRAAVGAAGTLLSPPSGPKTLKQWKADSFSGGNSLFGTTVSYGAGWQISDLRSQQLCESKAGVEATAALEARVFGTNSALLGVNARLFAGQDTNSTLSVKILGQELGLAQIDNESLEFNLVTGDIARDQTFFSVSQVLMVGPFPVRVAAAAAGFAGFDYDVGGDCDGSTASLTGSFKPYAGIKAQASAGISAVIVEVGMKIDLVLASLGLPLKAGIAISDVNLADAAVSFDAALDLEARFLDGRAALYAEVCYLIGCESWDFELFSWTGLRSSAQLFAASFAAPFGALETP